MSDDRSTAAPIEDERTARRAPAALEPRAQRAALEVTVRQLGLAAWERLARIHQDDRDLALRQAALRALVRLDTRRAIPSLSRATTSPHAEMRKTALRLLSELSSPEAQALLELVEPQSPTERWLKRRALARHRTHWRRVGEGRLPAR